MIRRTFLTHALGVGGLALLPGWLRAQSMDHSMHDMAGMDHMLQAHRSVGELVDDVLVALGLKEWDYSEKERVLDRY